MVLAMQVLSQRYRPCLIHATFILAGLVAGFVAVMWPRLWAIAKEVSNE
jgi:hypothetical protein